MKIKLSAMVVRLFMASGVALLPMGLKAAALVNGFRSTPDGLRTQSTVLSFPIDPASYHATSAPCGVLQTFADSPATRGFSWMTDATVTESRLWLLAGEHGSDDAALFLSAGAAFVGTSVDRTETNTAGGTIPLRLHKMQANGLAAAVHYDTLMLSKGASGGFELLVR